MSKLAKHPVWCRCTYWNTESVSTGCWERQARTGLMGQRICPFLIQIIYISLPFCLHFYKSELNIKNIFFYKLLLYHNVNPSISLFFRYVYMSTSLTHKYTYLIYIFLTIYAFINLTTCFTQFYATGQIGKRENEEFWG